MCGGTGVLGILDQARLLFGPIGLADSGAGLEFQQFLLPKSNPQHVSSHVHYAEQESDLFIDRLRCGLFVESGFLIFLYGLLVDID